MPANKTDPKVGASTCASGNQTWKGGIGILVANPIKNRNHNTTCQPGSIYELHKTYQLRDSTFKLKTTIPTNTNIEPKTVKKKK